MTASFLSLNKDRTTQDMSKNESKFNILLAKLTQSFHSTKKTKQKTRHQRRSSLGVIVDYFRSDEPPPAFANDALIEHNRYRQQKQKSNRPSHRHTQSAITATSFITPYSSCMTVNSEDLTAKEFADIAGIRIVPDEDDPVLERVCPVEVEEHHIWDHDFWRISPSSLDPPILHELKRHHTHQDTFIKRGRFEIHLSTSEPVPKINNDRVLEWKRKSRPIS